MPQWIIDRLAQEWGVIKSAPLSFVIISCLIAGLVYLVLERKYKERLVSKDDLLGYYREKLGLQPTDKTPYSGMRNGQLRAECLKVITEVRKTAATCAEAISQEGANQHRALVEAKTDEERKQVWLKQITTVANSPSRRFQAIYEDQFKIDVLFLRDEVLSRLPDSEKEGYDFRLDKYGGTNPNSAIEVVNRLERFAKLLPKI
jgi:hypothetical protein